MDGDRMGELVRRRLAILMRLARHLDERAGRAARGAAPLHARHVRRIVEQAGALEWALETLERAYPMAADRARRDLEREQERRREKDVEV